MADILIPNNQVSHFRLVAFDAAGAIVPLPPGDVDTVAAGGPFAASIAMSIGTMPSGPFVGQVSLDCAPTVIESDSGNGGGGITAVFTDSAGLVTEAGLTFGVTQVLTPTNVGVDPISVVVTPQPTPTAPGP